MGTTAIIGLVAFVVMLAMVMLDIPVFVAMFVPSCVGFWALGGGSFALQQFTGALYSLTADYSWTIIPLFTLMGILASESKLAERCFDVAMKWLPNSRGIFLKAIVVANAVFGSINGAPTASNAVFTKISLPLIDKYKYDKPFSLATVAASGILGGLIPPSTLIVTICVLVNLSIGRALVCGIVPGVVTAILFCFAVSINAKKHPEEIPMIDNTATWKERVKSLTFLIPLVVIFLLLIGGIYLGVYPATVGGAIGAFLILIYAFAIKMSKKKIAASVREAAVLNGQIFPMIIGGMLFSRLVALTGLANDFNSIIVGMHANRILVIAIIMIFYVFMGVVADVMPILIITLPIVFPLLTALGFDPYALCIIIVFMVSIGGLTPPLGTPVFIVSSISNVPPMKIFSRIWWYFGAQVVMCWLLVFVPQVATFLPDIIGGGK
jgi:C4-dicarboxylate transporter, DctM subunit